MRCQFLFKFPLPRNNLTEHIIGYYSQRISILFYFPMTWVLYKKKIQLVFKVLYLRMHVCVRKRKKKYKKIRKRMSMIRWKFTSNLVTEGTPTSSKTAWIWREYEYVIWLCDVQIKVPWNVYSIQGHVYFFPKLFLFLMMIVNKHGSKVITKAPFYIYLGSFWIEFIWC